MHASGELTRNNDVTRRARGYSDRAVIPGPEYQDWTDLWNMVSSGSGKLVDLAHS